MGLRPVLVVVGPTAVGKSGYVHTWAKGLCERGLPCEIINADSLSFYTGMDIGTAKPSRQMRAELPYHLIDCSSPDHVLNAGDFVKRVEAILNQKPGVQFVVVGGSHFYVQALVRGMWDVKPVSSEITERVDAMTSEELQEAVLQLDPAFAVNFADQYRVKRALGLMLSEGKPYSQIQEKRPLNPRFRLLGLVRTKHDLANRVQVRTEAMLGLDAPDAGLCQPEAFTESLLDRQAGGIIEETQRLIATYGWDLRPLYSVGYKQVVAFLQQIKAEGLENGKMLQTRRLELAGQINFATQRLIKSQLTWLRGWERIHVLRLLNLTELEERLDVGGPRLQEVFNEHAQKLLQA
jgi:tRNA dimethylallyltransferase